MKYAWLVALAVGTSACDAGDTEQETDTIPAEENTPAAAVTPAPDGTPSLQVATLPGGGEYLTGAEGRALYMIEGNDDPTACVDACATAWPPFTVDPGQAPTAASTSEGSGTVQAGLIATVQRPDGSQQVTYNGHPLYYYARDAQAGQVTGQDVTDEWGEWYLVAPSGEEQEAEASADASAGAS